MNLFILIFIPLFIALTYAVRNEWKRGYKVESYAVTLAIILLVAYYAYIYEDATTEHEPELWKTLIANMIYAGIIPCMHVVAIKKLRLNWHTTAIWGIIAIAFINFIPNTVVYLDGTPLMSPLPQRYHLIFTWNNGGSISIPIVDIVMIAQILWALSIHFSYIRRMTKKGHHLSKNMHLFGRTLLGLGIVGIGANLIPHGFWRNPSLVCTFIAFMVAILSFALWMIGKGWLNRAVLDSNDEPAEETIPEDADDMIKRVRALVEGEFMYRNPSLQIGDLAQMLGTNRTYISRAINEYFDKNFTSYVNKLRTDEATLMIINNPGMKFETIAEQCGFTSASLFTRVYKKETGMTPKEMRRKYESINEAQENN